MRYTTTSPSERRQMLQTLGLDDMQELFRSVPEAHCESGALKIPGPLPEAALLRRLEAMKGERPRVSLVGAGLYSHYIPAAAKTLYQRSEWVTSYTPYQPEIAQGTLVMYYEFQTWVAALSGQEIANGGMYDGSTAVAEAVLMAKRIRRKQRRVYLSEGLHPRYRAVLHTYLAHQDIELKLLPLDRESGRTRLPLSNEEQRDALAIVVQSPNHFGVIENSDGFDEEAFLIAVTTEAQSLGLLPPLPAQIAVGELQSLGIPIQLGGPTAGFFATSKKFVRQMPGRLVSKTHDQEDREAYCITLATREQFIRREKATSNICTSSGLMCLRSAIYLALMGKMGLQDVARQSARAARFFLAEMEKLGIQRRFSGEFFNEFVLDLRAHPGLREQLLERGFVLGVPLHGEHEDLEGCVLVALTEEHYPIVRELVEEVKNCVQHF